MFKKNKLQIEGNDAIFVVCSVGLTIRFINYKCIYLIYLNMYTAHSTHIYCANGVQKATTLKFNTYLLNLCTILLLSQ